MKKAMRSTPSAPRRRALLAGALALPLLPSRAAAQAQDNPEVAAYKAFVGARSVRAERLVLDIPRIADNGNVVPVRIAMPGPFAPGAEVKTIHLFSEKNPVPQMAVFHFPVPVARVEVESRVRLAGTQRVAAVATMADGSLYSATADIVVTVSACIDGT
jgi:sulfur-oxidizing protein SoxY